MLLNFMALLITIVPMVSAQDNVIHQGDTGGSQSVIVTARTRSSLSCESGDIVVKVNFTQPFRGLMYAHRSRNSPCRVHGTGGYFYQLRIPLKGCGTWQETPRVFVNNVTIRFHPALELEEDETKTVVCRYPPPLTPAPGSIQVLEPPTAGPNPIPTRVNTARLSEVEILIIICLLLFLSLLTLGIGIAYFCLKRRNIHIIRKSTTASSSPPSQITRLSSSNIPPPSSLLSSVLGHTVRIPGAVPYSAPVGRASMLSSPEHQYEEYPVSTSTTSGEVSETSVSSSSDDQTEVSKNLLFRKVGPRTLLSIPKAILRKTGPKRWRGAEPPVHNSYSRASAADATNIRRIEMEDQTVTTVLEPEGLVDEDDSYWVIKNGVALTDRKVLHQITELQKSDSSKKPIPVYAQVDKNKKMLKGHEINIDKLNIPKPEVKVSRIPARPIPSLLGAARRQRSTITDIPEESSTSEEITKNTTITTSVRREVTETRILSPGKGAVTSDSADAATETAAETESRLSQTGNSEIQIADQTMAIYQLPKNILIRDVADVYLTTMVETESRELKTHVCRDTVEEHTRKDSTTSSPKDVPSASPELKTSPPTNNWNVVIRQRQPPPNLQAIPSDTDANKKATYKEAKDSQKDVKPKFDVKIRTIPPNEFKPKESQKMVSIPPLEMPQTVSKLKEALMPKTAETSQAIKLPGADPDLQDKRVESREKTNSPLRTVRWMDDNKSLAKESTISSSDSFQSAESLRERSSSEVLEVAPTLPSQQKSSGRPVLERSSSEIVTSPDDHVRWVGGVVPVLETLSPEFLANIPVIQGGFFNQQAATSPKDRRTPT